MTFLPYPLDPSTPIMDSIGTVPDELVELPQRVRSWNCQTGSALCHDGRCQCTCHSEAANVTPWFGFYARNDRRLMTDETAHELTGRRNGFRIGYVGPTSLADLVGNRRRVA